MEKYLEIYNEKEQCNIKAKMWYVNDDKKVNHIFIFCHGFCSGKKSKSVKVVADKLLKLNIESISFDFPGHNESLQSTDRLQVEVCISYVKSVIKYVKETYGNDVKISFFAISFGAYVLLNKLIGDKNEYENIILRSPAINMKKVFKECLLKESFEEFKNNKIGKAGFGGKIEVPYSFYEDLENHDLYKTYNEKRKIIIYQGTLDDTADIKDTYEFVKDKPEIELIEVENMKHHISPEEIAIVADEMINKIF